MNWVWRESHVSLGHEEWFDIRARVEGSNQRAADGWFRMQVRSVTGVEYFTGTFESALRVEGRRYKPDGSLSSRVASAQVSPSQLPEPVVAWINHMTDGFRDGAS